MDRLFVSRERAESLLSAVILDLMLAAGTAQAHPARHARIQELLEMGLYSAAIQEFNDHHVAKVTLVVRYLEN